MIKDEDADDEVLVDHDRAREKLIIIPFDDTTTHLLAFDPNMCGNPT